MFSSWDSLIRHTNLSRDIPGLLSSHTHALCLRHSRLQAQSTSTRSHTSHSSGCHSSGTRQPTEQWDESKYSVWRLSSWVVCYTAIDDQDRMGTRGRAWASKNLHCTALAWNRHVLNSLKKTPIGACENSKKILTGGWRKDLSDVSLAKFSKAVICSNVENKEHK